MTYRPTVRYDDSFRIYVDDLFHATHLDRNQIIRAALFAAAHSREFIDLLSVYKKPNTSLPSPEWKLRQHGYWLDQKFISEEEERDVNANVRRDRPSSEPSRTEETVATTTTRREGSLHGREPIRIANAGGINFSL